MSRPVLSSLRNKLTDVVSPFVLRDPTAGSCKPGVTACSLGISNGLLEGRGSPPATADFLPEPNKDHGLHVALPFHSKQRHENELPQSTQAAVQLFAQTRRAACCFLVVFYGEMQWLRGRSQGGSVGRRALACSCATLGWFPGSPAWHCVAGSQSLSSRLLGTVSTHQLSMRRVPSTWHVLPSGSTPSSVLPSPYQCHRPSHSLSGWQSPWSPHTVCAPGLVLEQHYMRLHYRAWYSTVPCHMTLYYVILLHDTIT